MNRHKKDKHPGDDIELPREFASFAEWYFIIWGEDDNLEHRDLIRKKIDSAVYGGNRGLQTLIAFLDDLLDAQASDEVLARLWWRARPAWGIRLGFHRGFFAQLRDLAREVLARRRAHMKAKAVKRHG